MSEDSNIYCGIHFLGDLQRLTWEPGDRFVLTVDRTLTSEMHRSIQDAWSRFMGAQAHQAKLLVLDCGMRLGAVNVAGAEFEAGMTRVEDSIHSGARPSKQKFSL